VTDLKLYVASRNLPIYFTRNLSYNYLDGWAHDELYLEPIEVRVPVSIGRFQDSYRGTHVSSQELVGHSLKWRSPVRPAVLNEKKKKKKFNNNK
jgi:hypothetical protein